MTGSARDAETVNLGCHCDAPGNGGVVASGAVVSLSGSGEPDARSWQGSRWSSAGVSSRSATRVPPVSPARSSAANRSRSRLQVRSCTLSAHRPRRRGRSSAQPGRQRPRAWPGSSRRCSSRCGRHHRQGRAARRRHGRVHTARRDLHGGDRRARSAALEAHHQAPPWWRTTNLALKRSTHSSSSVSRPFAIIDRTGRNFHEEARARWRNS